MRLFIAIQLSEEMRKALVDCLHDLKKQGVEGKLRAGPEPASDPGIYRRVQDPEQVKQILASVPLPAFRLALSEKGNFGNILWAGVKGNQKLKTYVRDLRAALKNAGIPFEDDRFTPHITLIRKVSSRSPYQVICRKPRWR